jgi:hypothetical protein
MPARKIQRYKQKAVFYGTSVLKYNKYNARILQAMTFAFFPDITANLLFAPVYRRKPDLHCNRTRAIDSSTIKCNPLTIAARAAGRHVVDNSIGDAVECVADLFSASPWNQDDGKIGSNRGRGLKS